ncbi:isochorismatase family protein [Bordetella genomosp. 11]|uniref:Isochorismatase n=1 Tax=Bordetella genomosp. 11 TaxID=1416808 RepID=A0A261UZT6_9BORD|nr:isochorismatase family protein [Bordetella genomosp. 11]OZI67175.1 isochorismatase [Bordetella genomosp. 11]
MPIHDAADCTVLIVDMQARLMPVIHDGAAVLAAATRLAAGAVLLDVPVVATEHHRAALGATLDDVGQHARAVFRKMHFSAVDEPGFGSWLPNARGTIFVAGCEAHICVLQTALGLRRGGHRVRMVADACGSRQPSDRDFALQRARAHGIDVMTTEMALFEWLGTCEHPRFRDVLRLVK